MIRVGAVRRDEGDIMFLKNVAFDLLCFVKRRFVCCVVVVLSVVWDLLHLLFYLFFLGF